MPIRFGIDALVIVVSVGAAYAFVPVNNFAVWASREVGNVTVRLANYRNRPAWM